MTYLVCQTPKCQKTYPIEDFSPDSKNVPCSKCGGTLIDENGRANMSQNPYVIPVITPEEIEQNRKDRLSRKREELARLQNEIAEIEQEV
jgi:ribosomal protein S27E